MRFDSGVWLLSGVAHSDWEFNIWERVDAGVCGEGHEDALMDDNSSPVCFLTAVFIFQNLPTSV